jgi:predicted nucleotidyltransferase
MMNEEEHLIKLKRLAEEETKELSLDPEVMGVALSGSIASKNVWESSDIDLWVILDTDKLLNYGRYDKACDGIRLDRLYISKRWMDDFIERYPESFIQWGLLFLDDLYKMEPLYDPSGYLLQIKEFTYKNRFSPLVTTGRLIMGINAVKEGVEKARLLLSQSDYQVAWREARETTYAIADLWLEYDKQTSSYKTQDPRFAELSNRFGKSYIYDMYRHILGIDKLSQQELQHLSDDIVRNWNLHSQFFRKFHDELQRFIIVTGIKLEDMVGDIRLVLIFQGDISEVLKRVPPDPLAWTMFWVAWADEFSKQIEIACKKGYYGLLSLTWITMPDEREHPSNMVKFFGEYETEGLDSMRKLSQEIDYLIPHINDHRGFNNPSKEYVEEIVDVTSELLKETEASLLHAKP